MRVRRWRKILLLEYDAGFLERASLQMSLLQKTEFR